MQTLDMIFPFSPNSYQIVISSIEKVWILLVSIYLFASFVTLLCLNAKGSNWTGF